MGVYCDEPRKGSGAYRWYLFWLEDNWEDQAGTS